MIFHEMVRVVLSKVLAFCARSSMGFGCMIFDWRMVWIFPIFTLHWLMHWFSLRYEMAGDDQISESETQDYFKQSSASSCPYSPPPGRPKPGTRSCS